MEKKKELELSSPHTKISSQNDIISQPQTHNKGGFITMPFIIANESLARVATLGLLPNMILYLMGSYNLHLSKATHILLLSVATTNFMPLIGAFIADSHLGRFLAVGLGSIITFMGMLLLWLTAMIPQARPPPCNPATESCKFATTAQVAILISSLALMSIGNGGLQCSMAFGADQVNRKDNPNNQRALEIFFNWFLNKACFIRSPEKDIASDGSATDPWSLCTTDQVEEFKAIIKVIPLWSTSILMSLNIGGSFGLLQAKSLNRHITRNFEVPAGSLTVIMIFTIFIWIALYDRVIIPLASKLYGKQVRISAKNRMGLGLFFSFIHLVTAAIVETIRRRRAIVEGYGNDPHAMLNMSAMWLFPQLCLGGIAEAFNVIGQNEFYYTEFPKTMSSIASSLFGLGMAIGYVTSSFLFSVIERVTSKGGKDGWISDNINKGRFDKYYWVIATVSGVNILYYLVCSWAYGATADIESKVSEENDSNEEELPLIDFKNEGSYDKNRLVKKS
ncbi:protein NRT1/ PTR FAMILY 1.2-like isoform X2 [Trifolium pratense]|uniref:protein NRT1/ PTR FAMILY 1.2-like isoform X2 n=1 Tax=Trifolium pratense TaxID=57577 RepID=UPI001E6965DA|nr:protein NRT1/ PTR FAMILY 1.2-like isoform X2 [Trifolium pratense]